MKPRKGAYSRICRERSGEPDEPSCINARCVWSLVPCREVVAAIFMGRRGSGVWDFSGFGTPRSGEGSTDEGSCGCEGICVSVVPSESPG